MKALTDAELNNEDAKKGPVRIERDPSDRKTKTKNAYLTTPFGLGLITAFQTPTAALFCGALALAATPQDSLLFGLQQGQYSGLKLSPEGLLVDESGEIRGIKVYRVWGNDAGPLGKSWTPLDPRTLEDYREKAGLPRGNSGEFLAEGVLFDMDGVEYLSADPLHGNPGGLPEFRVPDPAGQIRIMGNIVMNPPF